MTSEGGFWGLVASDRGVTSDGSEPSDALVASDGAGDF